MTVIYLPKTRGDAQIEPIWEKDRKLEALGGQAPWLEAGQIRDIQVSDWLCCHRSAPCAIRCWAAREAWVWALRPPLTSLVPSISPPHAPTALGRRGAGDAGLPHQRLRPRGPGRDGRTGVAPAATPGAPAVPPAPSSIADLDSDPHSVTAVTRGGRDTRGRAGAAALAPGC